MKKIQVPHTTRGQAQQIRELLSCLVGVADWLPETVAPFLRDAADLPKVRSAVAQVIVDTLKDIAREAATIARREQ